MAYNSSTYTCVCLYVCTNIVKLLLNKLTYIITNTNIVNIKLTNKRRCILVVYVSISHKKVIRDAVER